MIIDLHCHALPGIDDGARDWDEALAIARAAIEAGTTNLVLTPHFMPGVYENTTEKVRPLVEEFQRRVDEAFGTGASSGHRLTVHPGGEAYLCPELPELAASGRLPTINGTRYVLVELPQAEVPPYADRVLFELQAAGFWPIIAHPERNRGLTENPEILVEWIKRGIPAQLNAGSLTGVYGSRAKKTATLFIRRGMVHVAGSDCHRGEDYGAPTEAMAGVAEAILAGRPVRLEDPGPPPKVSWWSRIFGRFRSGRGN